MMSQSELPLAHGDKANAKIRASWSLSKVVTEVKKSIRTDYGGASSEAEKVSRVAGRISGYPEALGFSHAQLMNIAAIVIKEQHLLRDGIAKRVANHTDELERRVLGT